MNISESIDMKGRLTIQTCDRNHKVLDQITINNSIVLTGRDLVAKLFIKEKIDPISHIAVGIGSTAVNPEKDEGLETPLFRKAIAPVDPTQNLTTTGEGRKKVTITAELDFSEANGALTEAGLFNAASGGVMYNRVVFPAINKTSDFKLTLLWEILF
jgi:hypothetical protein